MNPINYHQELANKFIKYCEKHNTTIFGSYLREYLVGRQIDFTVSDIDVFSHDTPADTFINELRKIGFRVIVNKKKQKKYVYDGTASVSHLTIGFANDKFFIGRKIDIDVDYVFCSHPLIKPPFKNLDFECNAFIWDENGIRLSRKTGTSIDNLSAREIRLKDAEIISNIENKVTTYFPLKVDVDDDMNSNIIQIRKCRIKRIIKMLIHGWKISGFDHFVESTEAKDHICLICQVNIGSEDDDNEDTNFIKLTCCNTHYHSNCIKSYCKNELSDRKSIRCPQRCKHITI